MREISDPSKVVPQASGGKSPTAEETELIQEVRAFARGGQLPLLGRVLSNIATHFGVHRNALPRLLWSAGLTMKQIERLMMMMIPAQSNPKKKPTRKKPIQPMQKPLR
jgi:hypothetical protein